MFYWVCVLGFAWLFGSWRGRQSLGLDSTVRAIFTTALLTVPVGALVGEVSGWFVIGGTLDSSYGAFTRARLGIWAGLVVGTVSVLWGKWQTQSHVAADQSRQL